MTPTKVLSEAAARFTVLLHDDPKALARLLRQALGKFQDKAGAILEAWQEGTRFQLPPHFQGVAGCCDAQRRYVPWRRVLVTDNDGLEVKVIDLIASTRHEAPFCLQYFADLRHWPDDEDLPGDCVPLLADYLEALIAVHNTERQYNAYLTAGMHENAQALISQQELRQRLTELEQAMEDNKSIVPPASMF